ncbi:2-phosphosulfolactate phosphatase [Neomoorella thermoacetica]|uniref:2-phosphosulfolactate phosphatase n=1 Tax=Neomoorella thermoacetica TaxID=1525 RepID=UPI0008FAF210|nr:2-phosphosulfolactate phosphatase [Moorella thermoacetica]APC08152.1 putative 2-phosphosulfolactate phosphatase [Moorella thermoacetica]
MGRGPLLVDVALAPSEVRPTWRELVCIVVDVIRASSTIVTLLDKGCRRVYTVRAVAEARALAREKGWLIGGERNGLTLKGFDFGNSPFELQGVNLHGKKAVLTTTNGTKVIKKVAFSRAVLVGCFLNASACCRMALELTREHGTGIGIVCAGEKGKFVLDDACCAGYLVKTLLHTGKEMGLTLAVSDASRAAHRLFDSYPDIQSCFRESGSGRRLVDIEREEDIASCSRVDVSDAVPVLINSNPCEFTPLN